MKLSKLAASLLAAATCFLSNHARASAFDSLVQSAAQGLMSLRPQDPPSPARLVWNGPSNRGVVDVDLESYIPTVWKQSRVYSALPQGLRESTEQELTRDLSIDLSVEEIVHSLRGKELSYEINKLVVRALFASRAFLFMDNLIAAGNLEFVDSLIAAGNLEFVDSLIAAASLETSKIATDYLIAPKPLIDNKETMKTIGRKWTEDEARLGMNKETMFADFLRRAEQQKVILIKERNLEEVPQTVLPKAH